MARQTQKKKQYDNEAISALKGADRVRKRPGVIFGSDGLEGCEHAVFEILSNAIDEARSGHGDKIIVTATPTAPSRWRTSAGAARWTGTTPSSATTGSWYSASSTPAASTAPARGTTMSSPWASTAWAPAPPSTLRNTLTPPSTGTAKVHPPLREGRECGRASRRGRPPAQDRLQIPLEARPGGFY